MTPEKIRELTNTFCRTFKEFGGKPEDLRDVSVVLARGYGYWDLLAKQRGTFNRRAFVTVIDLPADLCEKSLEDALIDMAGIISTKLSASSRIINSNEKRGAKLRQEVAKKASEGRWKKD